MSYTKQDLLTLREHLSFSSLVFSWGVCVAHIFSFCFVHYVSLRSYFRVVMSVTIKTMFGSSLPSVVRSRDNVLFTLFVLVHVMWYPTRIVVFSLILFVFVLCLVYPMLQVSLERSIIDRPFDFLYRLSKLLISLVNDHRKEIGGNSHAEMRPT